jgi:hypothetical protein
VGCIVRFGHAESPREKANKICTEITIIIGWLGYKRLRLVRLGGHYIFGGSDGEVLSQFLKFFKELESDGSHPGMMFSGKPGQMMIL